MAAVIDTYLNRRMAVLLGLGFASGLPFALTTDTLMAWMNARGVDLGTVGLFSLVALPYSLKFLWAPLIDRFVPPLLGRRRGWLLLWQLFIVLALVIMALVGSAPSLWVIATTALAVAFCSASQDIVVDAYRADVLPAEERGAGAAVSTTGWRIGWILSGAGVLFLVGRFDAEWSTTYLLMAAAMGIGILCTLLAPEPARTGDPPPTLRDAVTVPLLGFMTRSSGWLVLAFVLVFKLPDVLAGKQTLLFMQNIGVAEDDIAIVRQSLGMFITIVGALVGGGIVARLQLWPSLWIFAILQALSNLGFWVLAQTGPEYSVLVAVIAFENFCGGLVTAGFTAYLISQCDPRYSATQFALLTSVMALSRDVIGASTGYMVNGLGWSLFFLVSVVAALPGLLMLLAVGRASIFKSENRNVEDSPPAGNLHLTQPA